MPPWPFSSSTPTKAPTSPRRAGHPQDLDFETRLPLTSSPQEATFSSTFPADDIAPIHTSTSPRRSHTRSLSGNLPTLFGGVNKRASRDELAKPIFPPYDGHAESTVSPKKWPHKGRQDDGEVETGVCATCGSRVKWSRGISEFRCTTCLMVNDVKPKLLRRRTINHRDHDLSSPRDDTPSPQGTREHVSDLTLQRTYSIIDRCIDAYLEARRSRPTTASNGQNKASDASTRFQTPLEPKSNPDCPHPNQSSVKQYNDKITTFQLEQQSLAASSLVDDVSQALVSDVNQPKFARTESPLSSSTSPVYRSPIKASASMRLDKPAMPSRKPPPPPMNLPSPAIASVTSDLPYFTIYPSHAVKPEGGSPLRSPLADEEKEIFMQDHRRIFKPLEDYIIQGFGSHECINCSFLIARSLDDISKTDSRVRRSESSSQKQKIHDAPLSEVDAKTLLLGDVAENGLWWTGRGEPKDLSAASHRQDRVLDSDDSLVQSRSPCIDFETVQQWYSTVIYAGEEWRKKRSIRKLSGNEQSTTDTAEEEQQLDEVFAKAQLQVQRTLLKASDNLLKRPGRPLKGPSDIRFLLILLANPLLYAGAQMQRKIEAFKQNSISRSTSLPDGDDGLPPNGVWDQRHSFTILKRILGLLSNQSIETHRHLTSWFSRYNENEFRKLLDLVQSFVTYRLGRQQDRKQTNGNSGAGLIPGLAGTSAETSAQLHAALGLADKSKGGIESSTTFPPYSSDWQIKSAARIMALLFSASKHFYGQRNLSRASLVTNVQTSTQSNGQLLATSEFYNTMADFVDLVADFDTWEAGQGRFSFCQYPFFLSIGAKIRIMEHDARRQMEIKAREAFFNSILRNRAIEHYLTLRVRRDCLVEDSLKGISEVVGASQQEIKKELKVQFVNEEGLDAGGLRKEWFLLLVREIFEPQHGLFIYDDESRFCYFNPYSFETSDQYFLVGVLLGLAIYNSTILDVALPPFTFKKLLTSATPTNNQKTPLNRGPVQYTLDDLAEYRPSLARGLRQLLEFDGDVESSLDLNFVIETDRYGSKQEVALCPDGASRPVTNSNRQEFVDLYIRYLLDVSVSRQFEPFKRGFFTVCGGNALSLFQPEEIELLVRGSDEPLDVPSLKAVAVYENWRGAGGKQLLNPAEEVNVVQWFWEFFEQAEPKDQRKLLGFITGSDRIPALGATSLVIKIAFAGPDFKRFPIARTCFNQLLLYKYRSKTELVQKLWRAVCESEGFGLK